MAGMMDVRKACVILTLALVPMGCRTATGGGGGAVLCALDGTCPAGMTCAGQYCAFLDAGQSQVDGAGTDAQAGTDTGAGTTDTGAGTTDTGAGTTDTGAGTTDTGAGTTDTGTPDTGTPDTGTPDTGTPDTGTPDTGSPDAGGTLGVAALQQAAASKTCANPSGESVVLKAVTLTDLVVTEDEGALGKLGVFYVRPSGAPTDDGRWQGMKIVVFKGKSNVKQGDIVTLTGDLVEYFCETEIKVDFDKIQVTGTAPKPGAYPVVVAEVAAKGAQSEAYEGVKVILKNVEVVEPNVLGTDGKTHGQFGVAAKGQTVPLVVIGGTDKTTFTKKDPTSGQTVTTWTKGQGFASITGHLTYSFETYVLRPGSDAELVQQ